MKKTSLRKILAAAMAVTLSCTVVSCGNSNSNSNKDSSEPTVEAGKKGTIEYWTVFTGADGTNMQNIVDAYNKTDPDYTVNHRAMEANDLYLKLPLAIQSGQDIPDVAINHVERLAVFQENGFLTDLNPIIEGTDIKKDAYNPVAWDMSNFGDGHYGVPLDYHSFVTYVNMDLYEKYGNGALDDGILTWDEIKASGEATKADGIIDIGIGWYRANFLSTYGQLGGKLTSDGEEPLLTDDSAVKVLELWNDLYEAGYTHKEGDDPWKLFLGGQMLYCPEGIWMQNQAVEAGMNYKMVEYPAYSLEQRGGWTSSHNFVIPKDDKRPEEETKAAIDFINYVGENSLEWAKAGQTPANNAIIENSEFKEMPQFFLTEDPSKLLMYDYKYYGYATESLDKVLPEILFGRMSIEDGLKQAEQETKDRINTEG